MSAHMASSFLTLLTIVGILIPTIILVYGAYWALAIRKALFVHAYRSQALWIGFFSLYFIPYVFRVDSVLLAQNKSYALAVALYYIFLTLLLFRLVDVDVGVARRSDPLLRDTFRWRQLRLVVWAIMGSAAALQVYLTVVGNSVGGTNVPQGVLAIVQASEYLPLFVFGAPTLLVAARRSKDATFRRSLEWFGLSLLLWPIASFVYYLIISGLANVSTDTVNALGGFVFTPAAYFLYKSTRSLAPLDRIAFSEVV